MSETAPRYPDVTARGAGLGHGDTMSTAAGDDFTRTYEELWKPLVENPDGSLNRDQVMRELHGYTWLMRRVSEVYLAIAGSRISGAGEAAAGAGEDPGDDGLPGCCADYGPGHDPRLAGEGCRYEPHYGVARQGSAAYEALYKIYLRAPHHPGDWPHWLAAG